MIGKRKKMLTLMVISICAAVFVLFGICVYTVTLTGSKSHIMVKFDADSSCEIQQNVRNTSPVNNIILVTNFIPLYQEKYRRKLYMGEERRPTQHEMDARLTEITATLQHNLHHPNINSVHVMVDDVEAGNYIYNLTLQNSSKLVIVLIDRPITVTYMLIYASKCLQGNIVAISNQDNLFGKGWEKLNGDVLSKNKLMYALTRHSAFDNCVNSRHYTCGLFNVNHGCHDTFVLHLKETFTEQRLRMMSNVTQIHDGMENVFIWMFRHKFNYTVTNPCLTLHVHHQHCIALRDKNRHRVNRGGIMVTVDSAPFTSNLNP